MSILRKNIAASYLVCTYVVSWIAWGIIVFANQYGYLGFGTPLSLIIWGIGGLGPAFAIIILKFKQSVFTKANDVLRYIFYSPNQKKTILVICITSLMQFIIIACFCDRRSGLSLFMLLPYWLLMAIVGGGMEELGWRGFLQPEVEKHLPFIPATLIVGIIWTCWHIPLF